MTKRRWSQGWRRTKTKRRENKKVRRRRKWMIAMHGQRLMKP